MLLLCNETRADVGGHDDDGVLEADHLALRIRQTAVIENLQQHVEDIRVCLFDLIKQYNGIRLAAHCLGQLTALIKAYISRRRTDETRHRVLLHVLRHIETDHGLFVTEHGFRKRLAQLGLAYAGRAEENERADGAILIFQADSAAADGLCNGRDGFVLTDDTLVQRIFKMQQALAFFLRQLYDRDAGPHSDDLGDVFCLHDAVAALILCSPLVLFLLQLICKGFLLVTQLGRALEVLLVDGSRLINLDFFDALFHLLQVFRRSECSETHTGRRFIDEVDGLIRQVTVCNVARGELNGALNGFIGNLYFMVRLVAIFQTFKDLHRFFFGRLTDMYRLETTLQRGVFFNVLSVLVDGRRTDDLEVTARQSRL